MRRYAGGGALAAAVLTALVAACSTFSADDGTTAPPQDDASSSDAVAADGESGGPVTPPPCEAGTCPTTLLATSDVQIEWLALDSKRVIWIAGVQAGGLGDLYACPKTGCPPEGPTKLFAGISTGFLASNGETAFMSEGFGLNVGVWRLDDGGGRTKVGALGSLARVFWMVVQKDVLYTIDHNNVVEASAGRDRTLRRLSLPALDGPITLGSYSPADGTNALAVAVSTSRAYFGSHSTSVLLTCPLADCQFNFFSTTEAYSYSLATDDGRFFWVGVDTLNQCDEGATCTSPTIVIQGDAMNRPLAVLHHAGSLFIEMSAGDLFECKSSNCAVTKRRIAHESGFADGSDGYTLDGTSYAADGDALYYVARDGTTDGGNAYRVMRLPRSPW